MRIYLIRHGRQDSRLCNVNVKLSQEGRIQAELLGKRLKNYNIEAIYSSNLIRAVETADIVNQAIRVPHMRYEDLREIDFGELEGLSDEEIAVRYHDFKIVQQKMEADIPYPGGECGRDVYQRAMPVIEDIVKSSYNNVAIVTHGGVIRSLITGLTSGQFEKKLVYGKCLENTSITELWYNENTRRYTVERFNDYAHLEERPELLRSNWK